MFKKLKILFLRIRIMFLEVEIMLLEVKNVVKETYQPGSRKYFWGNLSCELSYEILKK